MNLIKRYTCNISANSNDNKNDNDDDKNNNNKNENDVNDNNVLIKAMIMKMIIPISTTLMKQ